MKNTKNTYLAKGKENSKDKQIKKYKRSSRTFLILFVILGIAFLIMIIQDSFRSLIKEDDYDAVINTLSNLSDSNISNSSQTQTICKDEGVMVNAIETFMTSILKYPGSFLVKLLILLGILYVIQVIFSLMFDIIELILIFALAIKKSVMWIWRKIRGQKNKEEEKRSKIVELIERYQNEESK